MKLRPVLNEPRSFIRQTFALGLIAAASLSTMTRSLADDWRAWRGTRGDGISRDDKAPLTWSEKENVKWKIPCSGIGASSPIIVDDKVFFTSFDPATSMRRLICVKLEDGSLVWSTDAHSGPVENQHRDNTSASATPTSDGQAIYAVFVDDKEMNVVACDMNGQLLWKKSPGSFFSKHGFAASPVLCKEGLIVNGHQDGQAFIVLLDPKTGESKWRYQPDINLRSFSTPFVTNYDGKERIIVAGANQTVCIDPDTGKRVWHVDGPTEKVVSTVSVGFDHVFSFGGSPEPRAIAFRIAAASADGPRWLEGDLTKTQISWSQIKNMPYVPTPLLYGKFLHVTNDEGIYNCLEPLTGKTKKATRLGASTYSSPIGVADRIYMFDDEGNCTVIKNNDQFEVLAKNGLGERVQTLPAFSDGSMIVRSAEHLWCIEERESSTTQN
ncbi:MAG: PQQ-binding-like beta-propeller repeat protein [Pirellula sp.]|nr:PQQ-binding-like beta-propeller repeat protein [Pirellula sp.]